MRSINVDWKKAARRAEDEKERYRQRAIRLEAENARLREALREVGCQKMVRGMGEHLVSLCRLPNPPESQCPACRAAKEET